VTQANIDAAREEDRLSLLRLKARGSLVLQEIASGGQTNLSSAYRWITVLEDLWQEAQGEGGGALDELPQIQKIQDLVNAMIEGALSGDALEKHREAQDLRRSARSVFAHQAVADMRRVPSEDLVRSVMSEGVDGIAACFRALASNPEAKGALKREGERVLREAVTQGYSADEAEIKLRLLRDL